MLDALRDGNARLVGERDQVYLSFDDAPLDTPGRDGDDTVLEDEPYANPNAARSLTARQRDTVSAVEADMYEQLRTVASASAAVKQAAAIVPHPRDLRYRKPLMAGKDVLALQRALARAGLRRWGRFTTFYGAGSRDQVKVFQRKHNLAADGVYGPVTHRKLAGFYDAYGISLLNQVHLLTPVEKARARLVTAAMVAYNDRAYIGYTQGPGRMFLVRNRVKDPAWLYRHQAFSEDCSSFATWLAYTAGVPDPNGLGYNGYGYTGTQAARGSRVWAATAPVGAFNFYGGSFPYRHVTVRVTKSGRCISHGSSAGPSLVDLFYRGDLRQSRVYEGLA